MIKFTRCLTNNINLFFWWFIDKKSVMIGLWLLCSLLAIKVVAKEQCQLTQACQIIVVNTRDPLFEIVLPANPTTGYGWVLTKYDANLIISLDKKFYQQQQANKAKIVGAPGYEKWRFCLTKDASNFAQNTNIVFSYKRSWEPTSIKEMTFTIQIVKN